MTTIPYGTQLSLWDDIPTSLDIVFRPTFCMNGCPFNGVYEAQGNGVTVYSEQFGMELNDSAKYLITIQKDRVEHWSDRHVYYIVNDQWEAYNKIQELTGRYPLWQMSIPDQYLPSNYASQGPKC